MSGYPDDRYDDRREHDRREPDRQPDAHAVERARGLVTVPATLLIVTGAIAFLAGLLGLIRLPQVPGEMDDAIAQIDANPNMPADQKKMWKDMLTQAKDFSQQPVAAGVYVFSMVCSLLVAFGGIKLLKLSGPTFPIIGSIL